MSLPRVTGLNNSSKQVSADAWNAVVDRLNHSIYLDLIPTEDAEDSTHAEANTATLAEAIELLRSITTVTNSINRGARRPTLRAGPGTFVFSESTSNVIDFRGFEIVGAGIQATTFVFNGSGVFLDFGTFETAPQNMFTDVAQYWRVADLSIIKPATYDKSHAGARTGQALRDSGSGSGRVERVRLGGFAYGLNCVFGCDFMTSTDLKVEYCDVGAYFGPACQQGEHRGFETFMCREGLVLDRPRHIAFYKPTLNSSSEANVVIEVLANDANTRQLTGMTTAGVQHQSSIVFDTPWFESAAAGNDDEVPDDHIRFNINSAETIRDVIIRNAIIVNGPAPTQYVRGFCSNLGSNSPQRVIADQCNVDGYMVYWARNSFTRFILRNQRVTSGVVSPEFTDGFQSATFIVEEQFDRRERAGVMPLSREYTNYTNEDGVRVSYDLGGLVTYAFKTIAAGGSYIPRLGFDVQNRRLYLDDPGSSTACSVTRASAMPSTGSYGIGSFVHNTAPAVAGDRVLLGWKRLTSGSGHVLDADWCACYAATV